MCKLQLISCRMKGVPEELNSHQLTTAENESDVVSKYIEITSNKLKSLTLSTQSQDQDQATATVQDNKNDNNGNIILVNLS